MHLYWTFHREDCCEWVLNKWTNCLDQGNILNQSSQVVDVVPTAGTMGFILCTLVWRNSDHLCRPYSTGSSSLTFNLITWCSSCMSTFVAWSFKKISRYRKYFFQHKSFVRGGKGDFSLPGVFLFFSSDESACLSTASYPLTWQRVWRRLQPNLSMTYFRHTQVETGLLVCNLSTNCRILAMPRWLINLWWVGQGYEIGGPIE